MVKNPPDGCQRIAPYLSYDDPAAAVEYLSRVFGFEKKFHLTDDQGAIVHAELGMGNDVVMLAGGCAEMGLKGRKTLPAAHSFVVCYVDDVDAHFAHAKAQGANIISEPEDQAHGDRSYRVSDFEDNLWMFQTHIRDVPPEEMMPG